MNPYGVNHTPLKRARLPVPPQPHIAEEDVFLPLRERCQHRPILPGRLQPSIVGTDELNYRVRNGNGWTLIVKDADFQTFSLDFSSAFLLVGASSLKEEWCTFRDSNPGPTD